MPVRKKILLIDDHPDISLFTALQEDGNVVIACESPDKALSLVIPYQPHFIIVHLYHSSKRDLAILQECRALAEGIAIIVAMSNYGNEAIMQALEERATSFLPLPAKPGIIKKVLAELKPTVN